MTNRDKLEQFITNNRKDFDFQEPPEQLWDRIAPAAQKVRKLSWIFYITRIAAVFVIFIAAYFFYDWMDHRKSVQTTNEISGDGENLEQIKILVEAEGFYAGQIHSAKQEITQLAGKDEQVIALMNADLDELTEIFESLKNDLKDESDNQEVIEAMIQNYRIRLEILNEMLEQLKKSEASHETQKGHEI